MLANMKKCRIANLAKFLFVLSIAFASAAREDGNAVSGWDPAVFRDASTIKIMTTEPDAGEHWSNLWVGRHRRAAVRPAWRSRIRTDSEEFHQPLCEIEGG